MNPGGSVGQATALPDHAEASPLPRSRNSSISNVELLVHTRSVFKEAAYGLAALQDANGFTGRHQRIGRVEARRQIEVPWSDAGTDRSTRSARSGVVDSRGSVAGLSSTPERASPVHTKERAGEDLAEPPSLSRGRNSPLSSASRSAATRAWSMSVRAL